KIGKFATRGRTEKLFPMSGPQPVPRLRVSSARGRRKQPEVDQRPLDFNDDVDDNDQSDELNIRVRDHGESDPPQIARKNRIGGLLKEAPASGLKNLSDIGGVVKRPLSGLFRRPGSRSGRQKDETPSANADYALKATTEVRSMSPAPRFAPSEDGSRRSSARDEVYDRAAADAPHVSRSQLQGLLEQVDKFASKYPNLVKLDDIDISLLSRFIGSEEEVQEEEAPWTWDTIFTSTSSEMRQEWNQDEDSGDDDPTGKNGPISLPFF
ncbi:hypothetical protein PFISCL1PPCAC_8247, partial [Pristionchus fissidentatus]